MALQKQLVPIPIGKLAQGQDPKLVPAGALAQLSNLRVGRAGEYRKRRGYVALGTSADSGSITTGKSIAALTGPGKDVDQLVVQTSTAAYAWSDNTSSWYLRSTPLTVTTELQPVFAGDARWVNVSSAYYNGWVCVVGITRAGDIYVSAIDISTGTVALAPTLATAAASVNCAPRVLTNGTGFTIFYVTSGAALVARRLTFGSPTLSAETTIVATMRTCTTTGGTGLSSYCFDVILDPVQDKIKVASVSGAGSGYVVSTVDSALTVTSTDATGSGASTGLAWLDWDGSDTYHWLVKWSPAVTAATYVDGVAYCSHAVTTNAPGTSYQINAPGFDTGTTNYMADRVRSVTGFKRAGNLYVWVSHGGSLQSSASSRPYSYNYPFVSYSTGATGGAITLTTRNWAKNCRLAGHAFARSGTYYVPLSQVMTTTTYQGAYLLVDESRNVIAKSMPDEGGADFHLRAYNAAPTNPSLAWIPQAIGRCYVNGNTAYWPVLRMTDASDLGMSPELLSVDFAATDLSGPAAHADLLIYPGGITRAYDGQAFCELGYHQSPEPPALYNAGGGVGLGAGTYRYVCVFRWKDARGRVHRSAPGGSNSITLVGTATVEVYADILPLTEKTNVVVEIYRTTAGGSAYYKLPQTSPVVSSTTANSTAVYSDTTADATLTTGERLYTDGGVLENVSVPACRQAFSANRRLWMAGLDDPGRAVFTKEIVTGEGPSLAPDFEVRIDDGRGPIRGGAPMDDKVLLFKQRGAYMTYGLGPDDTGQGSFAGPDFLSIDRGVDNARALIQSPAGVFFLSEGKVYVVTRGGEAQYIGQGIEDLTTATTGAIVGAEVWSEDHEIVFYAANGYALRYQYEAGIWTSDVLPVSTNTVVDSCRWGDLLAYQMSNGVVHYESASAYLDLGATFVTGSLTTAWIELAQLNGFHRLYSLTIVGEYKGAHSLRVTLYYDHVDSSSYEVFNVTPTANPYRFDVLPKRQKCTAIKIKIEDVNNTSTGETFRLTAITAEVGIKGGRSRGTETRMTPT